MSILWNTQNNSQFPTPIFFLIVHTSASIILSLPPPFVLHNLQYFTTMEPLTQNLIDALSCAALQGMYTLFVHEI